MPSKTTKIKASNLKPYEVVIGGPQTPWKPGVISLVAEDRLPTGAVVEARNLMQTQDGVWGTRWGSANYGASWTGPITGFTAFATISSGVQTQWYMVVDNGTLRYAKDGGSWTSVSAHSVDTTNWTNMLQYENKLLVCNGVDAFGYVDLNTMSWVGFTSVSQPQTLSLTLGSGLSTSDPVTTLYYQVTAITSVGETLPCAAASTPVNFSRDNWYNPNATQPASSNEYITLSWSAPATGSSSVLAYNIYLSDGVSGISYYVDSTNETSYTDYGSAAINDFIQVPTSNTTSAPEFSWITLSDNRLYACGDPNNPNRIYFAGTGTEYALAFNPAVGGGYVDILPGGTQLPIVVKQFRDGKGDPMTTVLMSEQSGYGSTWHVQVTTDTIGNTVIAVPTVIQAMGSFGTTAPRSVVETNQNIYFYSGGPAGVYSTGSVQTLFNILATSEISLLIRPDITSITLSASSNIAAIEYNRKLWFSVPYESTSNNRIMVYDLEKENWNPFAFDFGVSQFIHYRDNSGNLHLLAIPETPNSGNFIYEISQSFLNDNGNAFEAHLQTGLVHPTPDHVQFLQCRYCFYEFNTPQGEITVTFSGTPKNSPLSQLQTNTFTAGDTDNSAVGFDSFQFDGVLFDYAGIPTVESELSDKRRQLVNQLINNFEAEVQSYNANTQWTINQVIVQGFIIPTASPSNWVLN